MEQEGVPPPPLSAAPVISDTTTNSRTILGRYRLGRFLGQGSFAKVHEAHSLADNDGGSPTVAIKIIDKKAKTFDAAMEPLIAGEIEAMRRLKHHPNILRIQEVMATRTKIYLVMELAEGGELLKKIASSRNFLLKEPEARRYFQQLISALRFCHRNGVAHRDIKPQNLLLDAAGNLKVSDFGLSALPERIKDGMLHTACGTPAFTAPEILSRRRRDGAAAGYDGAKADAWSCGVILHVLLAGKLPFSDGNLAAMFKQIQSRAIEFPDRVSKTARRLIRGLLDPNPATRLSIEKLAETPWFRKSLPPEPENPSLFDPPAAAAKGKLGRSPSWNAFEIISLSSGLDLSGLFEPAATEANRYRRRRRRERRFAAAGVAAEAAAERVREAGERLGFRTERGKGGRRVGLGKGRVVLVVEVEEVDSEGSLVLGEVSVVDGAGDFGDADWDELSSALEEAGITWINDTV